MSAVRKLRTVVITGASSGLGRATALELATPGTSLVLAARDVAALEDTAMRAREAGADAIVVETDVTDSSDVVRLAASAVDEYGAIDVWINNAGVTLYAMLEEGSLQQHEAVIRTNLFGSIYGARAVLPIFRRQHHGILINVGSVLSEVGQAFVPSYVISKFGVHGLSEALRVEVADEPDIHVCTVFPYAIDTPHFEEAANELGVEPRALPPMQSPEDVARAIVRLVEHPRRTRFVPRSLRLGVALHALAPRTTERLLLDALRRWHLSDQPARVGAGNIHEHGQSGGKRSGERPPLISTWGLLAWLLRDFVRIQAESAARFTHGVWRELTERRELRKLARVEPT
ncbi:MAG: SDR family NAD(P)-dependent oxidoreductase [Kofleriaceae bacterium]|nr:SDR family NAD(P)-dependent oxidoreductase [Kofleriaceae bacterium]